MCRRYTLYLTNVLGALAAALLLTACDPFAAPESLFDEYVERAARVLDGKARLSPVPVVEPLPRRRERVVDIPPVNLSLLDFLSLYGCELQHVVGERNSIMGRVMHPASVYDYELRFLRAAEACLGMIDNDELAARLREAVGTKRGQLVDAAWNAVWATTEIEDFLTRSRGPLAVAPDRDMAATLAADLQALTAALAVPDGEPPELDFRGFDDVYQRWQSRPMAGQALRAAALASARLDDASALIEARLEGRPVCPRPDVQPRAAENMRGMFLSVYVGRVQPYLAQIQRVRRELIEPLDALARLGGGRREAVVAYADRVLGDDTPDSLWRRFDASVARHTRAWQELLGQCGMRPGP